MSGYPCQRCGYWIEYSNIAQSHVCFTPVPGIPERLAALEQRVWSLEHPSVVTVTTEQEADRQVGLSD